MSKEVKRWRREDSRQADTSRPDVSTTPDVVARLVFVTRK